MIKKRSIDPFQSYKLKKDSEAECKDKNDLTLFGAGSLFGYVPLLSGVATLKRHDARRGLLLTTTISSCILAAYDVSEAMSQVFNRLEAMIRVIHAIFNSLKGICWSKLELQQLNSFNSGLFLVYWYIFTAWDGLEPKVINVSN